MSHFTVAVFTDSQPTNDELVAILQPWHEYECTGVEDQYVVDVDETKSLQADYEKYGGGKPFEAFASDWSGAEKRDDGRWYRRTNPNAKWDSWSVGGRWTGMLKLKDGAEGSLGHQAWCADAADAGTADQARIADLDIDTSKPLRTFAVVKNGEWYEKGKMGWWATVSDEKQEAEWSAEFDKLLTSSGNGWITIVDCHI